MRWYGPCPIEGCPYARERFHDVCWPHAIERAKQIGDEMRNADFERDVRVQTEALRRYHDEQTPIGGES